MLGPAAPKHCLTTPKIHVLGLCKISKLKRWYKAGHLLVVNGVMGPLNGRKYICNWVISPQNKWSYFTLYL